MKTKWYFTIVLLQISMLIQAQSKYEALNGKWKISYYESPYQDTIIRSGGNGCEDYLFLDIAANGKMTLIFTNQMKSYSFKGKIKQKKDGSIKITNNIHEILFLGELEDCISAPLRIHFRSMFYRTFLYDIVNNKLTFYYNLPNQEASIRTIVFTQIKAQ